MKQVELAGSGNVPMLIWLGKQYLQQSDKAHHHISLDTIPGENLVTISVGDDWKDRVAKLADRCKLIEHSATYPETSDEDDEGE